MSKPRESEAERLWREKIEQVVSMDEAIILIVVAALTFLLMALFTQL